MIRLNFYIEWIGLVNLLCCGNSSYSCNDTEKMNHFRHSWSFPFDMYFIIYLNIMGINQDNQFDIILNKERYITVDYIHQFDGGNLEF